jgi:hypothetical protein
MDYRPLLKKAGVVLVAVGLLDVALMAVAIMSMVAYSSSLNIFAVIAGIFLIKGSLRAASLVRQFALFFLGAVASLAVVAPLILPLGLLFTQLQINPLLFVGSSAIFLLALGLFFWLVRVLGSPAVLQARQAAGLPRRPDHIPLAAGVGLAILLATVAYVVQQSDSATRAIAEAKAELGDEYNFYVSSIRFQTTSEGKSVTGVVTAWKSGSVKSHRFSWRE